MPKKVYVIFTIVLVAALSLVAIYLYQKSNVLEQKKGEASEYQEVLYDQSGRNIYSYSTTWNGEPVAQTAEISQFKEVKRVGMKIYGLTPDNKTLLINVQGEVANLDRSGRTLTLRRNDEHIELKSNDLKDIQIVKYEKDGIRNSYPISIESSEITPGVLATYNPPRFTGDTGSLIIIMQTS